MKKNISINLFGTLYAIDEDAYALLEKYMDSMKNYFASQEGGEEIADDIEHRVAELLWQQKQGGAEAVNIDDIKNIIKTIGNPADFENEAGVDGADYAEEVSEKQEEKASTSGTNDYTNYSQQYGNSFDRFKQRMAGRHLYRDPFRKVFGGVCSGLSIYFNYGDPVFWRLAFVLIPILMPILSSVVTSLTGVFGMHMTLSFPLLIFWVPIIYVVLLVVIPEARTPEDRLRMMGKEVNPENIQEEVLNEANGIFGGTHYGSSFNSYASSYSSYSSSTNSSSYSQENEVKDEGAVDKDETNAESSTSSSFTESSSATDSSSQSATTEEERAERERRARAASEQYYYYKKNQSSTGDSLAKGCGIGCLLVIFSPLILALIIVLFLIVVFAFVGMMVPFGLVFGDNSFMNLHFGPIAYYGQEIRWDMIAQENSWVVFAGSIAALIFVIIPIYALFRRFKSDRKRFSPATRTAFVLTWILSIIVMICSIVFVEVKFQKEVREISDEYHAKIKAECTINGIEYNETDFRFFRNNGWLMIEADNCSQGRFTYDGQYMTGDRFVRYLDANCEDWNNAVRYTARASETLQPGRYRLVANCRAEKKGAYIYCYNERQGKDNTIRYAGIPVCGNEGGNIWLALLDSTYHGDPIVKSLVDEIKDEPVRKDDGKIITKGMEILDANWGKGYGWSYVYIDNIDVKEPMTYYYGVTTVKDGKCVCDGWFSATDFRFIRIGD